MSVIVMIVFSLFSTIQNNSTVQSYIYIYSLYSWIHTLFFSFFFFFFFFFFSFFSFSSQNNNSLADGLGNLFRRGLALCGKYTDPNHPTIPMEEADVCFDTAQWVY